MANLNNAFRNRSVLTACRLKSSSSLKGCVHSFVETFVWTTSLFNITKTGSTWKVHLPCISQKFAWSFVARTRVQLLKISIQAWSQKTKIQLQFFKTITSAFGFNISSILRTQSGRFQHHRQYYTQLKICFLCTPYKSKNIWCPVLFLRTKLHDKMRQNSLLTALNAWVRSPIVNAQVLSLTPWAILCTVLF